MHLRVPVDPARSPMPRGRPLPAPTVHFSAILADMFLALHTSSSIYEGRNVPNTTLGTILIFTIPLIVQ